MENKRSVDTNRVVFNIHIADRYSKGCYRRCNLVRFFVHFPLKLEFPLDLSQRQVAVERTQRQIVGEIFPSVPTVTLKRVVVSVVQGHSMRDTGIRATEALSLCYPACSALSARGREYRKSKEEAF